MTMVPRRVMRVRWRCLRRGRRPLILASHSLPRICRPSLKSAAGSDGIPLAIELAAARLPLLGIEGLRARLDERFSVLTAGARMVLRRHQTLRATLEWSHGLLTPDQQTVFRRLGVFAGSFTLEAAQHVAQGEAIDEWSVLDLLGALIDKSLVLAEGDPVPRYRLLETARAYALERLAEAGETSLVMRRHAEALLQLVTGFDHEDLAARTTVDGLRAAAAEVDNLRAALTWTARPDGDAELAVGLIAHSYRVWRGSGSVSEGLERGLALRGCLRDDLPPALVAHFWLGIANLGLYTSRMEAYDAARRAADAYRALDEPMLLFDALVRTAILGVRFGTIEDMGAAIAEAERLVRPDLPAMLLVRLEFARSRWFARQGQMKESLAAAERQCAIARDNGNELSALYGISNVVAAQIELGQTELGLARARQAIARLEELGRRRRRRAPVAWRGDGGGVARQRRYGARRLPDGIQTAADRSRSAEDLPHVCALRRAARAAR